MKPIINEHIKRIVIWFSAGVTSAIAAKLVVDEFPDHDLHLVNTDTGSEDEDNFRFMDDVSNWLGLPLEIIRSEKYKDTFDVYDSTGFMKNQHGARCTVELKKIPRRNYEDISGDLQVFGFDWNERGRVKKFIKNNPEIMTYFPLIERKITKSMCRRILLEAGIHEPRTYAEGFNNANCLNRGCVKGAMGYWNHIRKMRPEVFWNMAKKEREIGYAINAQESRGSNGERIKTPVFLDELDPRAGNHNAEPAIQCGLFCGM